MTIIFIFSAIFILYTYIGYPLMLTWLSRKKADLTMTPCSATELDDLTIVMAMYNGEQRIEARLDNLLDTDYPLDKLHIVVVSDGSTDNGVSIAQDYDFPNLTVVENKQNQGKAMALNSAIDKIKTPLVAFADIRQNFNKETLPNLAKHFSSNNIGAVTGNLIIQQNDSAGASTDPGIYWRYEKHIRLTEAKLNSVVGVTGAIYMIRAKLFKALPADTILDDVYTPMSVIKQGYRVIMADNAYAFDYSSKSISEEFHRKVRTLAGNYQLMRLIPWINIPSKNPIYWQWLSHKVCRLLVPFALIALFITSFIIAEPLFQLMFIAQCAFYLAAFIGYRKMAKGKSAGILTIAATFMILNSSAFIAFFKYFLASPKSLWKKH